MTQERAIATRSAVLHAGARVFAQYGYAGASIAQILDEAGVTKGALYFHFDSKQSLAEAIIAEQSNWRVGSDTHAPSPVQRLVDMGHRFGLALRTDPLVRASIRLTLERETFMADQSEPYLEWVSAIAEMLVDANEAGELLDDIDPYEVGGVVAASVTGTQLLSEAVSGRADVNDRITSLWRALLPGIVRPDVLARTDLTVRSVAPEPLGV